jgi:hypothetical protein
MKRYGRVIVEYANSKIRLKNGDIVTLFNSQRRDCYTVRRFYEMENRWRSFHVPVVFFEIISYDFVPIKVDDSLFVI